MGHRLSQDTFERYANDKGYAKRLDELFALAAPVVEAFAKQRGMAIRRWLQGDPIWRVVLPDSTGGMMRRIDLVGAETGNGGLVLSVVVGAFKDYPAQHERAIFTTVGAVGEVDAQGIGKDLNYLLGEALAKAQGLREEELTVKVSTD